MAGLFGIIGAAAGLAGRKPEAPEAPVIDTQAAQKKAIAGNIANLPEAEKLASAVDIFNQSELTKMLEKAMPGWGKTSQTAMKKIQDMLEGKIPESDVGGLLRRNAAYGVGSGTKGSEFLMARTARDYGLTQEQQIEKGITAAESWAQTAGRIGTPQPYSATSMFVTPSQELAVQEANAFNQWNVDWLQERIRAMPGPLEQEVMGSLDWIDSLGKSVVGGYVGMATGSAMGGGGQGAGNWATGGPSTMKFGGGVNSFSGGDLI